MNAFTAQLIAALAIVLTGIVVFRYFPLHANTKDLTTAALLIVLSVILSFFSLMVPLFGFMSFKLGFSQMPLMLLGVLLGPSWAFLSGLIQDVLDIIINPSGFPFFGFTLNKVLIGVLPALWFSKWNKREAKQVYPLIKLLLIGIYALTLWGILSATSLTVSGETITFSTTMKWLLVLADSAVLGVLYLLVVYFSRKYPKEETRYHIANWIMAVLLVEITVQLVLTPTWLDIMYGIPYIMNVLVRMMKAGFMLFLNVTIGYFVLKTVVRIRK